MVRLRGIKAKVSKPRGFREDVASVAASVCQCCGGAIEAEGAKWQVPFPRGRSQGCTHGVLLLRVRCSCGCGLGQFGFVSMLQQRHYIDGQFVPVLVPMAQSSNHNTI